MKNKKLIPFSKDENGNIIVSGRDLHDFLEIKTEYGHWIERMIGYGFTENVDFSAIVKNVESVNQFGGVRKVKDIAMTLDMAKEISMIQRNEKGKQARQYFIEVEKAYKEQLSGSYMIADPAERARAWAKEFEMKRQYQLENEELKKEREANAKWVAYAKSIAKTGDLMMIGTLSTFLEQAGIKCGQNILFRWLRRDGFLVKSGKRKNDPTTKSKKLGLFKLIETPYYDKKDGKQHHSRQTLATQQAVVYFIGKYGNKEDANKLQKQIRLL